MEHSFGNFEYKNKRGENVDFEKKRFQFWLETVPEDIRRLEYELSKRYRNLLHANLYKIDNKQEHGRFLLFPGFDEAAEKNTWGEFKKSFLSGSERIDTLNSIISSVKENISEIILKAGISIDDESVKLIALGGSSFYGPRRSGERLSDVDIYILLDKKDSDNNFEVFPKTSDAETEVPYHIIGTGSNDESRGEKRQIHWLLYPHLPIVNRIENVELKSIISNIIEDTRKRESEIRKSIDDMDVALERLRVAEIRENHKNYLGNE